MGIDVISHSIQIGVRDGKNGSFDGPNVNGTVYYAGMSALIVRHTRGNQGITAGIDSRAALI